MAAIGTIAAVVVALWLAGRESRERKGELERRQAELISAWLVPFGDATTAGLVVPVIAISNESQQLVYRVIASLVPTRGAIDERFRQAIGRAPTDFRVFKGELPLGRTNLEVQDPGGGMHIRFGVELAFRDAAGRSWVRKADGHLLKIRKDPAEQYGLHEPLNW